MKRVSFLVFCVWLFTTISCPAFSYSENIAEEVIIYAGEVKIFAVNIPYRIVVGKPDVADVTGVTETEITVSAKAAGTTTFVFWDSFGEQDFKIRVITEDLRGIKQRIDTLLKEVNLPNVYTKIVENEGKILLLGEVKSHADRERIDLVLAQFKDKTVDLIKVKEEEAGVDIDVQVLELSKDASKTLGFTFPGEMTITELHTPALTSTKWGSLFRVFDVKRDAFTLKIDALVQEGKARILSRPRLACQSGKEAELQVGGEKPIFASYVVSGGGTGATVSYKEYGIKLKIKPTVTADKRIKLGLSVLVSEVEAAESLGTLAKAYPLKTRNISTELYMDDDQTLAIGGLTKQKDEKDVRKVPWLGDIPVLGVIFRQGTTKKGGGFGEKGEVELFITLNPKIIQTEEEIVKEASLEARPAVEIKSLEAQGVPAEFQGYIKAVQARISGAVYYPKEAKHAGWQGTVKLGLLLSSDGSLKEVVLNQSSGYKILDDAALEAVKKMAPFYAFPNQINLKELRIEIPVVYHTD